MSSYSHATCKAEVVLAPDQNTLFCEKIAEAVLLSGSGETQVSLEKWSTVSGGESFFSYSAIIALDGAFVAREDVEDIGSALSEIIPLLVGRKDPLHQRQSLLICRKENSEVIDTFCEIRKINKAFYFPDDEEFVLCYWSAYRANIFCRKKNVVIPLTH